MCLLAIGKILPCIASEIPWSFRKSDEVQKAESFDKAANVTYVRNVGASWNDVNQLKSKLPMKRSTAAGN